MDEEIENWVKKKMFYDKHGSETFKEAKLIWLASKKKSNFLRRWWWNFSINNDGSLIMAEIKPIQERLICKLIMKEDSQSD